MEARLPLRFKYATVAQVTIPEVIDYNARMRENMKAGHGLVLQGAPGVGKTYAMAALTNSFVSWGVGKPKAWFDYEFVTAPEMFERLDPFGEHVYDERRETLWAESYVRVAWLVINDLGKEYRGGKVGDQVIGRLARLVRHRSEAKKATHITTNFTTQELRSTYGEAVVSMLKETCLPVIVKGKDRRGLRA